MHIASFTDSLTSEFFYREAQLRPHARPDAQVAGLGALARGKWERIDVMRR